MKRTVGEIARTVGARTVGDERVVVTGVASLDTAGACDLVFVEEECYLASALDGSAAAVIAGAFAETSRSSKPLLITSHPRLAFARAAACLRDPDERKPGVHPSAVVLPSARVAGTAIVDPWTFVAESAVIGERTWIGSGCVVGSGVVIGDSCRIYPRVTIYPGTRIGDRVIVHAGAVLGSDGFGYVNNRPAADRVGESAPPRTAPAYEKFPQIGKLHIEDDVEIGANTTIDRGASRDTVIGEGTKIDNLVQIAHNVVIGRHCVIVSGVGISGSTTLEDYVVLGGQVGVVGHLRIGRGAQIAGSSNVNRDVPPGSRWGGTPAKPVRAWFRELTTLARLAERSGKSDDGGEV